ncbi:MAG: hypothetical protein V1900_00960 [Candidatus Aenigmatarchaeota archaeon]
MVVGEMILKNYKILIWLFFILISFVVLVNINPGGFKVDYIGKNSTVTGIAVGDVIYSINDKTAAKDDFTKEYYGNLKLNTDKGIKFVKSNGTLSMSVSKVELTKLNFGLDLKGGVRALIQPNISTNDTIEQTLTTLQNRINLYGLRESSFRPIWYGKQGFIEISMAGGSQEELRELLEHQGKFDAKIPIIVKISNGTGEITLDKKYQFIVGNNYSITVDGKIVRQGEEFTLAGIPLVIENVNDGINITSKVFTGKDIVTVFFDPQKSRVERLESGYRWSFSIQLSSDGAQRFAWITQNIPRRLDYLESQIYFYLDDKLIDSLNIASGLKGKIETEILITGGANTLDSAKTERSKLQSILRSGALPTTIQVVQMDTISPNLGEDFIKNAMLAGIGAILGVSLVILVRYRKMLLVVPMLVISLTEIFIILGMSVLINWTIDLSAIAGIIIAVGTGINDQIIIIDQALRKEVKIETLREKLRDAFFMVYGAGGTIIAAMIPLFSVLSLRGFAITTIIGVLVGLIITRPAFSVLVEKTIK